MPRFVMIACAALTVAPLWLASAQAADVKTEAAINGASEVTLYLHKFLTDEDLTMLRLVQSNDQALAVFVPGTSGFAALAAAPEEGFIRGGQPVSSAVAIADLPDLDSAKAEARKTCDQLRRGKSPCEVILTVAPKP